jgi:D-3-phosphoglycerate dehydrogenase / 2-oxoglutarate reductase
MTVLACDPYVTGARIAERGARKVGFDELLRRSDFVSVHCPRNQETFDMFRLAQFRKMKPSAYFINTARGGIHNETDLVQALEEGAIAGAGVDVFLHEPPPLDHPLFRFDNVVATPHTAGVTVDALHAMAVGAAEQWMTIFDGDVPPRLVNAQAWPLYSRRFEDMIGFQPAALD